MKLDRQVLEWYDMNARALPWRGERDPYRIWLSEIMLQQTGTKTVEGYYARFLERFPDVFSLAEAEQDEVLKLWEGLGYYSRARNLHAAARQIAASGGAFPTSAKELMGLPGIGPYTARAIASIAFGEAVPALDGNQLRVLSRYHAIDRVLATPFDIEETALEDISRDRPGDYNQALMDLGAEVCTPTKPKCGLCPLAGGCAALREGDMERYPMRPAPIVKKEIDLTIVLLQTPKGIAVRQRPEKGLLGGLWEFLTIEGHPDEAALYNIMEEKGVTGLRDARGLPNAKHVFTHLIWHMRGFAVRCERVPEGMTIADRAFIEAHAFPGALRKYRACALDLLDEDERR